MKPYFERDGITLYHGDCRNVLRTLEREDFGVLLTDPPYGLNYVAGKRADSRGVGWTSRWTGVGIDGDSSTEVRDWVIDWWGNGPALIFATWKAPLPRGVREVLVWDKVVSTGMGNLSLPWRPSWEMICVLGTGFIGPREHGVLSVSLPTMAPDRRWHPTPKPVPLAKKLIAKCPPEWVIIDPFVGAGSVAVAAKEMGRRCVGIDSNARYLDAAVMRLAQGVLTMREA